MADLSITLLGPFQVTLDGTPVDFESDKVRALLAFLAAEPGTHHRREKLAGLLWPGGSDPSARNNLRHTLAVLRKAIGDRDADRPVLHITRQTVQFEPSTRVQVDLLSFASLLQASGPDAHEDWQQAATLYQGDFLQDLSLPDSPEFEEWALLNREQFRRQALDTLYDLAGALEEQQHYEAALEHARRQVELDPCREEAHAQAMRLLALSGRRSEALAQYQACRRVLADELGVDPSEATRRLYEQVRAGELDAVRPAPPVAPTGPVPAAKPVQQGADQPPALPAFLTAAADRAERPVFVAREQELAQLQRHLDLALTGQGRVLFVTGDAGSGKTALVQEFARRAQAAHPDTSIDPSIDSGQRSGRGLIFAGGHGNAQTGVGDPYLPFREILDLLVGDVEARWSAGAMTLEQARRLWSALPLTGRALVEEGPDLLDTFVGRASLQSRVAAFGLGPEPWLDRLAEGPRQVPAIAPAVTGPQPGDIFEQYTRVLQALARHAPLLLAVDDLQWADLGSISLLFHLGRQLAGSRILIVGAYRPEEIALGRPFDKLRAGPSTGSDWIPGRGSDWIPGQGQSDRHPLEPVVHELQRQMGDIIISLGQAESRGFVDALLDSEPNRLGSSFREMLQRRTRSHPLFTVELLRGLQERGDLVRDPDGAWIEGPSLAWDRLPARVEAVIAERIGRLPQPLRAALRVACVEGEEFTAEVAAQVLGTGEREMVRLLGSELDRKHRLVRAQALGQMGARRASRYRFRHSLFQQYLYENLDPGERAYLHEDVGSVLEEWYGGQTGDVALELARHFREARIPEKEMGYLRQAGERAVRLCAYQEGVHLLSRAVELLHGLPQPASEEERVARDRQELDLQLALGMAWKGDIPSREGEKVLARARQLCEATGRLDQLARIAGEMSIFPYVRAEHEQALDLGEEALNLAQQVGDPLLQAVGHWHMGFVHFARGEFLEARAHLQQVIDFYRPQDHHQALVFLRGVDVGAGAMAYDACSLWCLGYPDQAEARRREALALARQLDHPFTLADVLCFAGCVFDAMRLNAPGLEQHATEMVRLSARMNFLSFEWTASCYQGVALAWQGRLEEGLDILGAGLEERQAPGVRCYATRFLGDMAQALVLTGKLEEGLATLAGALALVEETTERFAEAELHRLRAELLLAQGDEAGAQASYLQAMEVARSQQARSWELRAANGLARLWMRQGRMDEARQMLAPIYGWFTEGFDTPDLEEAEELLSLRTSGPSRDRRSQRAG